METVIEQVSINGTFYGLNKITGEIIQFHSEEEANEQCALGGSKAFENLVYKEGEDIAITIELNSECNLKCIYCYQTDKGTRSEITTEIIEMIVEYISKVYERYQFRTLVLRFIGGEPLLSAEKLLLCYREIMKFCKDKGIVLYTHIDTNGTMPYNDLLQEIMNLDMVICLSLENDHNVKRYGSFNKIINNLYNLPYWDPCPIVLRYNVAHDNIHSFENFLIFEVFLQNIFRWCNYCMRCNVSCPV